MKLFARNTINGLIPLYPSDLDQKRKLKIGKDYEIDIKHPRNYEFHKKFYALINLAHDNTQLNMPFDAYRKYLIMKAGYFNVYETATGKFYDAMSISFASMNQIEFEQLYSRVLDEVLKDLGCTQEDVMENLVNFF